MKAEGDRCELREGSHLVREQLPKDRLEQDCVDVLKRPSCSDSAVQLALLRRFPEGNPSPQPSGSAGTYEP